MDDDSAFVINFVIINAHPADPAMRLRMLFTGDLLHEHVQIGVVYERLCRREGDETLIHLLEHVSCDAIPDVRKTFLQPMASRLARKREKLPLPSDRFGRHDLVRIALLRNTILVNTGAVGKDILTDNRQRVRDRFPYDR